MLESLEQSLTAWKSKHNERTKLQHTYIISALVLLIAAGLVGLLNQEIGQFILIASILCAAIFLANAVIWALLQSAILSRIATKKAVQSRKK